MKKNNEKSKQSVNSLQKYKDLYKCKQGAGNFSSYFEVLRKNPKGFYNILGYIKSESELDAFILNDIETQKSKRKK